MGKRGTRRRTEGLRGWILLAMTVAIFIRGGVYHSGARLKAVQHASRRVRDSVRVLCPAIGQ